MAIEGIIVGVWRGQGVLLCRHRNDISLTFVIDEYIDDRSSHPLWFANFSLESVTGDATPPVNIGTLIGRLVWCNLQRCEDPQKGSLSSWMATQVRLTKRKHRIQLPSFKTHLKARRGARTNDGGPAMRRIYRKHQGGEDNLRRPWRG